MAVESIFWMTYVVCEQALQPAAGGVAFGKGLPRAQFGRSCPHREIWLRRGASQGTSGQLPDDDHSFGDVARPIHASLGCGLSEIPADARRAQISHPRGPTHRFATIQ